MRDYATDYIVLRDRDLGHVRFLHFTHMPLGNTLVLGDDQLAGLGGEIEPCNLAAQTLGDQLEVNLRLGQAEAIEDEELAQNLLGRVTQRFKQDRDRHLATTVNAEIEVILRVVSSHEPR